MRVLPWQDEPLSGRMEPRPAGFRIGGYGIRARCPGVVGVEASFERCVLPAAIVVPAAVRIHASGAMYRQLGRRNSFSTQLAALALLSLKLGGTCT